MLGMTMVNEEARCLSSYLPFYIPNIYMFICLMNEVTVYTMYTIVSVRVRYTLQE